MQDQWCGVAPSQLDMLHSHKPLGDRILQIQHQYVLPTHQCGSKDQLTDRSYNSVRKGSLGRIEGRRS